MDWDATAVKEHIRLTSQRLGQLQAKLDSDANVTRKDIATLLQAGNVWLARTKAQKLVQDDAAGDLVEALEKELGTLLERFSDLNSNTPPPPQVLEAVSTVIYASPYVQNKELATLRTILIQRMGPDFAQAAMRDRQQHVAPRIINIMSMPTPSASTLNAYLATIATSYGVKWSPDPMRHNIGAALSDTLNAEAPNEIDMVSLRRLCAHGIPDDPTWLRPRIWKLFLGLLPPQKASWAPEIAKQRDLYYDLVRRLLDPYTRLPEPSTPPHQSDEFLLNIVHHLSRIPRELFSHLAEPSKETSTSPLSEMAKEGFRIPHSFALDERLNKLPKETANLSLQAAEENKRSTTPSISVSDYDSGKESSDEESSDDEDDEESSEEEEDDSEGSASSDESDSSDEEKTRKVKKPIYTRAYSFGDAHPLHGSAILRLLFIHASINPGQLSPHIPALLVPLYTALQAETDPEELSHVEADTFWLFEAIVAEFSDLEPGEGSQKWMTKLDRTLAWADLDLHEILVARGLEPSLPHYSYRWLATVLTYTIPIPVIFVFWDSIFARLARERESNPKLDFLVDLTCAMLVYVRKELTSIRRSSVNSNKLWELETKAVGDRDPFLEGISLLQNYPKTTTQDAERIIQLANDLVKRRELEHRRNQPLPKPAMQESIGAIGARLRHTMWKGFTNQIDDSDEESPLSDADRRRGDGNETERPSDSGSGNGSWWGSISAPKIVLSSSDNVQTQEDSGYASSTSKSSTTLWNYAEKLRDSDTAAVLAKAGTNWRAKAMTVGTWVQTVPLKNGQSSSIPENVTGSSNHRGTNGATRTKPNLSIPPSPPSPFRSPTHSQTSSQSSNSSWSPLSTSHQHEDETFTHQSRTFFAFPKSPTFTKTPPQSAAPKAAPRPLLLNVTSPITSPPLNRVPTPDSSNSQQWVEVMRTKRQLLNRDSRSSISSLSPSEALRSGSRSDWESDSSSRFVPLNRRSVSPMAPSYRVNSRSYHGSPSPAESFSPSALSTVLTRSPIAQSPELADAASPVTDTPTKFGRTSSTTPEPLLTQTGSMKRVQRAESNATISPSTADNALPVQRTGSGSSTLGRSTRVRARRQTKPVDLTLRTSLIDGSEPSNRQTLTVDWPADDGLEAASTPRASTFSENGDSESGDRPISPRFRRRKASAESRDRSSTRKSSRDGQDPPPRKGSFGARSRKISTGDKDKQKVHHRRESAADEGDDEGYDDLLSAYESEDLGRKLY